MFCKKCGKEIDNQSVFCNFCGDRQEKVPAKVKKITDSVSRKRMIQGAAGLLGVIVIIILFKFFNNPVNTFFKSVEAQEYEEAISLYDNHIKGDLKGENKVSEKFKKEIEETVSKFKKKTIDYDQALLQLESIQETKLLSSAIKTALKDIKELQESRVAYKSGLEFKKSEKYIEAVNEFNKVIEADEDYKQAQEEIEAVTREYKADIIEISQAAANEGDYAEALKLITDALKVIYDDDLLAKETSYKQARADQKEEEARLKKEELKSNQEVEVVSIREYTNRINTNFIAIKVINNTPDKTVKSYDVGFMAYDSNGLPIRTGLGATEFVGRGKSDQNILPGETVDSGGGWYLDNHQVVTLKACISGVEYYENGETWTNPYYDMWIEEFAEKPLQ